MIIVQGVLIALTAAIIVDHIDRSRIIRAGEWHDYECFRRLTDIHGNENRRNVCDA
jgi:hypothetical protein